MASWQLALRSVPAHEFEFASSHQRLVFVSVFSDQRQRQLTLGDLLLKIASLFLQGEIYPGNATKW